LAIGNKEQTKKLHGTHLIMCIVLTYKIPLYKHVVYSITHFSLLVHIRM